MQGHIQVFVRGLLMGLLAMILLSSCEEAPVSRADIDKAERIIGIQFTDAEKDSMLFDLLDNLESYAALREVDIPNSIPPALRFDPMPVGKEIDRTVKPPVYSPASHVSPPENREELAFYSVRDLSELIRTVQITSTELTRIYLDRLEKYGPQLECVVTLTEEIGRSRRGNTGDHSMEYPMGQRTCLPCEVTRPRGGRCPIRIRT